MTRSILALAALGLFTAPIAWAEDSAIVRAGRLPVEAHKLRVAGVSESDVDEALRSTQEHGLSAGEAEAVLEEGRKNAEEGGPIDNFGKFVNDRLDEGLRGRELAQAIRAEHARQGKGGGRPQCSPGPIF